MATDDDLHKVVGNDLSLSQRYWNVGECIRFLFAVEALVFFLVETESRKYAVLTGPAVTSYFIYSSVLFIVSFKGRVISRSRLFPWLDVAWYGVLVFTAPPHSNLFFLLLPFAIIVSSLRFGAKEGSRLTLASALLFVFVSLLLATQQGGNWIHTAYRTAFLILLGLVIARWGGTEGAIKRRLALMREVGRLANPRFGTDQTIALNMERLKDFFKAGHCLLIYIEPETKDLMFRQTESVTIGSAVLAHRCPEDAHALFASALNYQVVLFNCQQGSSKLKHARGFLYAPENRKWSQMNTGAGETLADVFNATSYIGTMVRLGKTNGALYICSENRQFSKEDALFLHQATKHAFSMIDQLELLDRLATQAAGVERQRIVRDLHDSTIQPYIGLKLGLQALRNKAASDNPLASDIDELIAMSDSVISDLRTNVERIGSTKMRADKALQTGILEQVQKFRDYYGIEVDIRIEKDIRLNDRLAVEVLQMISEGLSNIRKHTAARRAGLALFHKQGRLRLEIQNESHLPLDATFHPRSISQRATSLGGQLHIERNQNGDMVVAVEIPV